MVAVEVEIEGEEEEDEEEAGEEVLLDIGMVDAQFLMLCVENSKLKFCRGAFVDCFCFVLAL